MKFYWNFNHKEIKFRYTIIVYLTSEVLVEALTLFPLKGLVMKQPKSMMTMIIYIQSANNSKISNKYKVVNETFSFYLNNQFSY